MSAQDMDLAVPAGRMNLAKWLAIALAIGSFGAVIVAGTVFGVDVQWMVRDPSATAHVHPLTGVISHLNSMFWFATATLFLATGTLQLVHGGAVPGRRFFLINLGLFALYLGVDDLFLIHESLGPALTGLKESRFLALILVFAAALALRYRRLFVRTDMTMLALSMLAFGVMLGFDVTSIIEGDVEYLLEDGAKWVGSVFLLFYAIGTCHAALRPLLTPFARQPAIKHSGN